MAAVQGVNRTSGPGLPVNPRPNGRSRRSDIISTIISTYSTDDVAQYSPSEYTDESSPSPFLPIQGTDEDSDSLDELNIKRAGRVVNRNDSGYGSSVERPQAISKANVAKPRPLPLVRDSFAFVTEKAGISHPFEFTPASILTPPLSGRISGDGPIFRMSRPLSRSSKPAALNLRKSNGSSAASCFQTITPLTAINTPELRTSSTHINAHNAHPLPQNVAEPTSPSLPEPLKVVKTPKTQRFHPLGSTTMTSVSNAPVHKSATNDSVESDSDGSRKAPRPEVRKMKSFFSTREKEVLPNTSRRRQQLSASPKHIKEASADRSMILPPTPPSLQTSPTEGFFSKSKGEMIHTYQPTRSKVDSQSSRSSDGLTRPTQSQSYGSTVQPAGHQVQPRKAEEFRSPVTATSPTNQSDQSGQAPAVPEKPTKTVENEQYSSRPYTRTEEVQVAQWPSQPTMTTLQSSWSSSIPEYPLHDAQSLISTPQQPDLSDISANKLHTLPQSTFKPLPPKPRPTTNLRRTSSDHLRDLPPSQFDDDDLSTISQPTSSKAPSPVPAPPPINLAPPSNPSSSNSSTSTSLGTLTTAPQYPSPALAPSDPSSPPQQLSPNIPPFAPQPSLAFLVEQRPPPPADQFVRARDLRPSMVECHGDHGRWHGPRERWCEAACMLCQRVSEGVGLFVGDGEGGRRSSETVVRGEQRGEGRRGDGAEGVVFFQCTYCALWVCGGCKVRVDAAMPGRRGIGYGIGMRF